MRIQHNIPAMNSYRNYSSNVSKVSKSLEKLSTGYRVNRAGDDAAGLAISEKMRIQMTGLEQAQTNAKAGINLVQTAEGALTEVHDMLNRMFTLAEQSANGTYDNTTDRKQLQKEVAALKDEINRIADSSNYNGIKLLDGSLEDGGATSIEIFGNATATTSAGGKSTATMGTGFTATTLFGGTGTGKAGTTVDITLSDDKDNAYNISLELTDDAIIDKNSGNSYALANSADGVTDDDVLEAMKGAVRDATGNAFELVDKQNIKSLAAGAGAPTMTGAGGQYTQADGTKAKVEVGAFTLDLPKDAKVTLSDLQSVTKSTSMDDMKKNMFTINGQKFLWTTAEADVKAISEKMGDDVTVVAGANHGAIKGQIAKATGLTLDSTNTADDKIIFTTGSGSGLRLQIGDTADDFNKLKVSVNDCHTSALGIAGVNIGSQGGAATALEVIRSATNKVSDIRGGLGALQNRLDHTINNLSVAQENITEAESTIRDTDVAKEMMNYTKNNILVQSAQAMLAQANQLPQGVLQLLG